MTIDEVWHWPNESITT